MVVTEQHVDIPSGGGRMRTLVVAPAAAGRYPGVVLYSDIFQLTGPHVRATRRLAGHGFVVASPEIYHRLEPPGAVIPFDDAGRTRGLDDAQRTSVAEFDADCRAALDHLARDPRVLPGALGVAGFCIGGHLAFRGALQPDVRATVACYPTGVHNGKLGKDADAGTLGRLKDIRGALLLVYGATDPHVPEDARATIARGLAAAGTRVTTKIYAGEHAFMRDEGPRFDPASTDEAFREAIAFLRTALQPV